MSERTCGTCRWWTDTKLHGNPKNHLCEIKELYTHRDAPPCPAHDDGSFEKEVRELMDFLDLIDRAGDMMDEDPGPEYDRRVRAVSSILAEMEEKK